MKREKEDLAKKKQGRVKPRPLENPEDPRLQLGVGVRADFAVQVNFFVLGGFPFHDSGSFEIAALSAGRHNTSTPSGQREEAQNAKSGHSVAE